MTIDKYKGESLGKKIARAWFWCCAERATGKRFYTHKHLVLASREGGDVAVLKAMGVHPRNIVAMEINAMAAREFSEANPDVQVRVGDAGQLVNHRDIRGKVIVAHLDFCSWTTPSVLDVVCRVGRFAVADGGLLSVGFMKGRETGSVADAISWWRENSSDVFEHESVSMRTRGIRSWSERVKTTGIRSQFLQWALVEQFNKPGPIVATRPLASIGYDSGRTPMLYCPFRLTRHQSKREAALHLSVAFKGQALQLGALAYDMAAAEKRSRDAGERRCFTELATVAPEVFVRWHPFHATPSGAEEQLVNTEFGEPDPAAAVVMSAVLVHHLGTGIKPHDLLNLRHGRLAAWSAHASRGTYGPEIAKWLTATPLVEQWAPSEDALDWAARGQADFYSADDDSELEAAS